MTVREDIAQIRKLLNADKLDMRLSNQFLYNRIIDTAKLIIRREADGRKIFKLTELFKPLDCIDLEPDEFACAQFFIPGCKNVMKSVKKLPKAYLSSTGSVLQVFSVDRSVQFNQVTPAAYTSVAKREFKGNEKYFWIQNDYLYIPNSYVAKVLVDGLFINNADKSKCEKILDSSSSLPDGVRMDILRTAASDIASITLRIPKDESPDNNSNKKN